MHRRRAAISRPPGNSNFPVDGYRSPAGQSTNTATQGFPLIGSFVSGLTRQVSDLWVDLANWTINLDQGLGLIARARQIGLRATDAYVLTYFPAVPRGIAINRYDNEDTRYSFPFAYDRITLDPNRDNRRHFTGFGRVCAARCTTSRSPALRSPVCR